MFELDREIEAWCRAIIDNRCASSSALDELKDHMHCLVEEYMRQGKSEEQAFVAAIQQMGDCGLITAEYARNSNLLQKLAAHEEKIQRYIGNRFTARQLGWFQILWALSCAGLMMLIAFLSDNAAVKESARNWVLLIWFIPFSVAASAPHAGKCDLGQLGRFFTHPGRRSH